MLYGRSDVCVSRLQFLPQQERRRKKRQAEAATPVGDDATKENS